MPSRLPISLTQLQAKHNSQKNLKMREDSYYILCIIQKIDENNL